jgi:hypothetical protein
MDRSCCKKKSLTIPLLLNKILLRLNSPYLKQASTLKELHALTKKV